MMKLVECIPNFSVSRERDEAAFNALVETAQAVAGCTVLDVQSDGTHNRCVFTLVGSPEGIGEAAFRLAKRAMEVIDMTKHQGAHPRMGATDVIPFVPTMDMTVEECVELSRQVAQRIWEELGIPSFLYEESATAPGRVNLAKIRKGQFEGMPEKLLEPEWAPDFGERKIHPTAGIIAIGARMPLIAYNINLDTPNVEIASAIADKLGLELQIDDMEFDSALLAVQNNTADVMLAGLSYSEERDEVVDFTDSYATGVQVVIVKEGSDVTLDNLGEKMIGTQRGTTGFQYASAPVEEDGYGEEHVTGYDNGATAVQELINGTIDAVIIDSAPAQEYVAANPGLKVLDTSYAEEDYAIGMAKGSSLEAAVNAALEELKADGTLQSIVDKYITAE